jgi:hypothetical protein
VWAVKRAVDGGRLTIGKKALFDISTQGLAAGGAHLVVCGETFCVVDRGAGVLADWCWFPTLVNHAAHLSVLLAIPNWVRLAAKPRRRLGLRYASKRPDHCVFLMSTSIIAKGLIQPPFLIVLHFHIKLCHGP